MKAVTNALLGLPKIGLRNPRLRPIRNRHYRTSCEDVFRILPVQAFQQPSLDGNNLRVPAINDLRVQDATATLVAKITILLPPTITHPREMGNVWIVVDAKEGKDGGSSKGRGRLSLAVDAVAVKQVQRFVRGCHELDGATSTLAVHCVVLLLQ